MDFDVEMWSCSPQTRSRKKRERADQAAQLMQWKHDEGLRRRLMASTKPSDVEPPTPTQPPRPICSRLITSPTASCSTASTTSSARPSKRRATAAQRARAGAINIAEADRTSEKIDALLAQFSLAQMSGESVIGNPLRSMSTNTARSTVAPSPLGKSISASTDWSKSSKTASGSHASSSSDRLLSSSYKSTIGTKRPAEVIVVREDSTTYDLPLRKAASPTKQSCPRIGLRSSQSAVPSARRQDPAKQFKPPLLNPPTRSSPRRHPTSHPVARTPVKTPLGGSVRSNAGVASLMDSVPRLPPVKRGKEPSSDGPTTGDESFDSFDGMFENGGEDIERLLNVLDGAA